MTMSLQSTWTIILSMEKVSIVIPTRNRAHLLVYALRSALEQTYEHIEVVVCDNHSKDNTQEVVHSFPDRCVVSVRTDRDLSMPENWEFALGYATGDYVAYLTDDSYFFPDTIKFALREIKRLGTLVAVWKHCAYFAEDWKESARRNIVYVPHGTGQSVVLDSKESLKRLYDLEDGVTTRIPKSLNSICHMSIIKKVKKVQKNFFLSPCPDYTSAAAVLFNTDRYAFIDAPLYLDGVTPSSIGATTSFNMGKSSRAYIGEFQNGLHEVAWLGIPSSVANIAKGLEAVEKCYPHSFFTIDTKQLVYGTADRLVKAGLNGANVEEFWRTLNAYVVACRSPYFRASYVLRKFLSLVKWLIIKYVRSFPMLEYAEFARGMHVLRGERWGFQTIEECARILQKKHIVRFP